MNFLNTDFGSDSSSDAKGSTSAEEFRQFYLSYRSQIESTKAPNAFSSTSSAWGTSNSDFFANPVESRGDYSASNPGLDSTATGKAGPVGTLIWNTLTLAERSVKNYTRNLLAYGVRAGMYGGELDDTLAFLSEI